jgi:hypothetical protein
MILKWILNKHSNVCQTHLATTAFVGLQVPQTQSKRDLDCNIEVKQTTRVFVPSNCHVSYDSSDMSPSCMRRVTLSSPEHSCFPVSYQHPVCTRSQMPPTGCCVQHDFTLRDDSLMNNPVHLWRLENVIICLNSQKVTILTSGNHCYIKWGSFY